MKTALVTGGNKGIGLAAVKGLAEAGFKVYLGARDVKKGEAAKASIKGEIEVIQIDVSNEASIKQAAINLGRLTDKLDVLVNNAGIYIDQGETPLTISPKAVIDTFTTNTLGPLLVVQAFLPLLQKADNAQIINVSSGMGQLDGMQGGSIAYRISKTALNAVTKTLASEVAGKKIAVNSICPGWVKTDMGGAGAPGTPEQAADTIIWLAQNGAKGASGNFYRARKQISW